MSIFSPIFLVGRTVNSVCTAYCCAQVGLSVYKKVRDMQKEKIRAGELRESFVKEYEDATGVAPPQEIVQAALKSYNVVEHPLYTKVTESCNQVSNSIKKCIEGEWLDNLVSSEDEKSSE